jgi:hypothetical protein
LVFSFDDEHSELRKLHKKKGSYMRLGFGDLNKNSIGHRYVLELWPKDLSSAVHNHGLSYGVVMMLHGEVNITLYDKVDDSRKELS